MGIPNFLVHILKSAGRIVDLRNYSNEDGSLMLLGMEDDCEQDDEHDEDAPPPQLRIAIDASTWIYSACQGYSDILADENHMSNYGRATLLLQQQEDQKRLEQNNTTAAAVANDNNPLQLSLEVVPPHLDALQAAETTRQQNQQKQQIELEYVSKACATVVDRLLAFQRSTRAEILVVLDGATPPIKSHTVSQRRSQRRVEQEVRDGPVDVVFATSTTNANDDTANSSFLERRIQANRRTGAGEHYDSVVDAIVASLRSHNVPFLVSPYEADAQLAFLQLQGHVDLVVSEDSDLIAYGLATPVLYKSSPNPDDGATTRGVLLRKTDLAARRCNGGNGGGTTSNTNTIQFHETMDFTPAMWACLFACLGCDYCAKLKGIGPAAACRLVRDAFFPPNNKDFGQGNANTSPLELLLKQLLLDAWGRRSRTDEDKERFERDFLAAVVMFRHAVVFDPVAAECRPMILVPKNNNEKSNDNANAVISDVELMVYPPYAKLVQDPIRRTAITGPGWPSPLAIHIAEGWINTKKMSIRQVVHDNLPAHVQQDLDEYKLQQQQQQSQESRELNSKEGDMDEEEDVESADETQEEYAGVLSRLEKRQRV